MLALLDAYEKIGKSLPVFSEIDDLFLSHIIAMYMYSKR